MDETEERLRTILRQELDKHRNDRIPPNLYGKTQTLIRDIASSVAPQLRMQNSIQNQSNGNEPNQAKLPFEVDRLRKPAKQSRNRKNKTHPYRLSAATQKEPKLKTIKVCLLDYDYELRGDKYRFETDEIVNTWYVDIDLQSTEAKVRACLVEVFKKKLDLIGSSDFEFVECNQRTISIPETAPGMEWNAARLKVLWGQGKLYCRLRHIPAHALQSENVPTLEEEEPPHQLISTDTISKATSSPPTSSRTRTSWSAISSQLLTSATHLPTSTTASCTITAPTSNVQSLLIGSSQERKDLKEEIDDALRKSEAADWEKANKSKDEEVLKKLQQDRLSRVLPEPELIEEHTVISVRHKTLGTKRRLFPQNATFANVYDWVGSLSEIPKFFGLHIPNQRTVQCWEKVESFGKEVLVME
eukprot:TCONS_00043449-protein